LGVERLYQIFHLILQGSLAIVRNGRGGSVLQGLILAAVYAKYHSAGRTTAGGLILSDSTPKNKLIYQFIIKSKALYS
jgi:hypothetical protein